MKQKRHSRILKIIAEKDIKTQEQLTAELKEEGYMVTQATVSRDIKELGLVKISSASGDYKYATAPGANKDSSHHLTVFSNAVTEIRAAMHTVVIKTYAGMAQAVAASLDSLIGGEIVGSIAGDDTILIITETPDAAESMCDTLSHMFQKKGLGNA